MAAASKPKEETSSSKFFRCVAHGALSIVEDGVVLARFKPFFEKWEGVDRRVGYLETADPKVIERLEDDGNVESITEREFKDATGDKARPAPLPTE